MSSALLARSLRISACACPRRIASRLYSSGLSGSEVASPSASAADAAEGAEAPRRRRRTKASAVGDEAPKKPKKRGRKKDSEKDLTPEEEYIAGKVVHGYLDQIASAGPPSVEDLEQMRVKPCARTDQRYERKYLELLERLTRSFNVKQLQHFAEECYGLDGRVKGKSRRNKAEWAALIMEGKWGWPSLGEVQKERRDWSEVVTESYPLDAREAFLLLGPNGSNLKSLSVRHKVHLSFSSRPLSVKAEGFRGSIAHLREAIKHFRHGILEDTFELPVNEPISDDLLHRISRRVGAYLQNERPGVVRISYRKGHEAAFAQAQRLVARSLCETDTTLHTPVLAYAPADINSLKPLTMFPQAYSLYPFLSPRSIPWTLNVSGAFRVRKVGDWLRVHGAEEVERTGGLSGRQGRNIGLDGEHHDIREALLQALPGDVPEGFRRTVCASTGHVLFTRPPAKTSTLLPPLAGTWSLNDFAKWAAENDAAHVFSSDLPSLLQTAVPQKQDQLHRLVYRAVDDDAEGHFIIVEALMEKVEPVKKETEPVKGIEPEAVEQEHADAEVAIKADNAQKLSVQEGAEATEAEDAKVNESEDVKATGLNDVEAREEAKEAEVGEAPPAPKLHVACTVGVERQLQVLLPDRPLDLQFSVTDSRTLDTEHIPGPLKRYLDDLNAFISEGGDRTRPITPVMVKHDGRTYVVHSSQSVGRSTVPLTHRVFSTDTIHASALEEPASASEGAPSGIKDTPTATKERVLDLEGGERTNICRVEVPVGESDAEWETFLRTCDRLTCPALPEQAPKAKLDFAGSSVTDGAGKEAEGESS